MKKIILLMAIAATTFSCNQEAKEENDQEAVDTVAAEEEIQTTGNFGEAITEDGAMPASELTAFMEGKDSVDVKVKGSILATCSKKGCWMDIDLGEDQKLKVRFKDYGFFVPKEGAEGKTAIFEGKAYFDTLTVEILQHYAEDDGKSAEEIAAITEPKVSLAFEAKGVIIKEGE